ncbi:hypothetical protein ACFPOE_01275 [Caenimonas terrae]|uniref:Uncharacterized protein n=1 Tax=Caenimonas terrae TaxID=696074 RepID=A0ABW0N848_9BURK
MTRSSFLALTVAVLLLAGCASKPKAPDWELEAHGSLERYVQAFMAADARVESSEFLRAREQLTRTGDAGLVARAELTRCALSVASLVFEPCVGFDALRPDAPAAERAYGDYLAGKVLPPDVALLPPVHRAVAAAGADAGAIRAIGDPLARLVAAGVLFETGRASPEVLQVAVDTASAQGWRRPLLAWLGAQARRAELAGAQQEAERLRRRIALVLGELK